MSVDGSNGSPDPHGVEQRRGPRHERVEDRAMDIDPRGRGAVLAGVDEGPGGGTAGCGLEVGVGVDDERRLATELEVDALDVAGGERLDPLARLRVAGQRDEVDVRMGGQRGTDDVAPSGDDVEDPGRHTGLGRQLGEPDRRDRSGARRLEHDRVARRERRTDLPDRHPERVVPGATWPTTPIGSRRTIECGCRCTRRPPCPRDGGSARRRSAGCPRRTPGPTRAGACRPSRSGRLEPGQLVGVPIAQVGEAIDRRDPFGQRHPRPAPVAEGSPRGGNGDVDVRLGPGGDATHELAGRGAVDVEPGAAGRRGRGAVDEHPVVGADRQGHDRSPRSPPGPVGDAARSGRPESTRRSKRRPPTPRAVAPRSGPAQPPR